LTVSATNLGMLAFELPGCIGSVLNVHFSVSKAVTSAGRLRTTTITTTSSSSNGSDGRRLLCTFVSFEVFAAVKIVFFPDSGAVYEDGKA
jgi:hypothetical protein